MQAANAKGGIREVLSETHRQTQNTLTHLQKEKHTKRDIDSDTKRIHTVKILRAKQNNAAEREDELKQKRTRDRANKRNTEAGR